MRNSCRRAGPQSLLVALALLSLIACGGGASAPQKSAATSSGGGASAPRGGGSGAASAPPDAASAATVDGTGYTLTGDVTCEHTDDGSIYDAPASMWHATRKADDATVSYVNLTIWQLKQGGPEQFSIGLQVGGVFHHASTIKGATLVGTGSASVERTADKATLHARGSDEKGVTFDVTLRCAKVSQAVEEGGR